MPRQYNPVTGEILQQLRDIVGEKKVLTDEDILETYARDETVRFRVLPEAVIRPERPEQVQATLALAYKNRIPVTPRGAGTGLSGGAIPLHRGLVLSLEKMNRILEIDEDNLMVRVEPGVITGALQKEVEARNLFYPPDPASLETCSIGGNLAECAGGPRAVKYGVTRDYVVGLKAVLPDGREIQAGGKLVKNVTGYDLLDLLIGSEGTLAVITEITLKLLPLPRVIVDLLIPYDDLDAAARTVSEIIRAHRIIPTALELMGRSILEACAAFLEKELPHADAEAHLIIELDGNRDDEVERDAIAIGELCTRMGARDVLLADNPSMRARLWEARRAILDAAKARSTIYEEVDVVVPRSRIPDLFRSLTEISGKKGVTILAFGHAGDGNVHCLILKEAMEDLRWKEMLEPLQREIFDTVLSMGGTLTGEHGIGCDKKEFLSMAIDPAQIAIMKAIKDIFDPEGILNPGKIF